MCPLGINLLVINERNIGAILRSTRVDHSTKNIGRSSSPWITPTVWIHRPGMSEKTRKLNVENRTSMLVPAGLVDSPFRVCPSQRDHEIRRNNTSNERYLHVLDEREQLYTIVVQPSLITCVRVGKQRVEYF